MAASESDVKEGVLSKEMKEKEQQLSLEEEKKMKDQEKIARFIKKHKKVIDELAK